MLYHLCHRKYDKLYHFQITCVDNIHGMGFMTPLTKMINRPVMMFDPLCQTCIVYGKHCRTSKHSHTPSKKTFRSTQMNNQKKIKVGT